MARLGLGLREVKTIVHGSTLVINTIVQERGARVGLITTEGFRDVLELGRGNRPEIYNPFYKQPAPLVPRYLRYEVPERLDWQGEVLTPLMIINSGPSGGAGIGGIGGNWGELGAYKSDFTAF